MIVIAIDAILALVLVEAVALVVLYRRTGHGIRPGAILGTLAAGFFLMLATRLAIRTENDGLVAACFLAAFIAHLLDLAGRWRKG